MHGVQGDRVTGHLDLPGGPEGYLAYRVLTPLTIALDVDDDAAVGPNLAHQHVDHSLQCAQVLAPPADQRPEVTSGDVEHGWVAALADAHLAANPHAVDQLADQLPTMLGDRIERARHRRPRSDSRRLVGIDHRHLNDGLLRRLAEDLHIDVATALAELDQGRVDRLVEGSAAPFGGPQLPCLHSCPQPVTKYC